MTESLSDPGRYPLGCCIVAVPREQGPSVLLCVGAKDIAREEVIPAPAETVAPPKKVRTATMHLLVSHIERLVEGVVAEVFEAAMALGRRKELLYEYPEYLVEVAEVPLSLYAYYRQQEPFMAFELGREQESFAWGSGGVASVSQRELLSTLIQFLRADEVHIAEVDLKPALEQQLEALVDSRAAAVDPLIAALALGAWRLRQRNPLRYDTEERFDRAGAQEFDWDRYLNGRQQ